MTRGDQGDGSPGRFPRATGRTVVAVPRAVAVTAVVTVATAAVAVTGNRSYGGEPREPLL